jgi:hypothetical protein
MHEYHRRGTAKVRISVLRKMSSHHRCLDKSADSVAPFWRDVLILCVLTAVYVGAYLFTAAIPDTTRDLYAAYEISMGRWFPLEGPILGWAIHASPFWYYLLAIPLLFVNAWVAVALFVGAIAGLKFILAYVCGTRLINREFGILWSIAIAMPGWTTIQHLTFFTPNIAETSILLSLYFAVRLWESPNLWRACVLGLVCGLALNTHPTTLPILLISLAVVLRVNRGWQRAKALTGFFCACVAPFIPYLFSQALHGAPDIATGMRYVESNIKVSRVTNIPDILRGTIFDGPILIAQYINGISGGGLLVLKIFLVVALISVIVGLIGYFRKGLQARVELFAAIGTVAMFSLTIAMLRSNTPFYFVYVLTPPLAALVALAICAFARWMKDGYLVYCFAAIVIALQSVVVGRIGWAMHEGVGTLPHNSDVATAADSAAYSDIWFPSLAQDETGRFLCGSGDGMVVHGPMAYLVDRNAGVDTLIHCDRALTVQLGGMYGGSRHVVGMPRRYWNALSQSPQCWLGPLGLVDAATIVWAPHGVPPVSGRSYPPRSIVVYSQVPQTLSFEAPNNEALLLTNVTFGSNPSQVLSVKANGRELQPIAGTQVSSLYVPPAPGNNGKLVWEVQFSAMDPSMIDAIMLNLSPSKAAEVPSCDETGLRAL